MHRPFVCAYFKNIVCPVALVLWLCHYAWKWSDAYLEQSGVRCVAQRLEWGKPDERGRGYDKGLLVHEVVGLEGGLVTDVARRTGKGREHLFLCVLGKSRTLDLEFPSRAARDEWWGLLQKWRDLHATGGSAAPAAAGLAISVVSANATTTTDGASLSPSPSVETTPPRPSHAPGEVMLPGRSRISPLPSAGEAPA